MRLVLLLSLIAACQPEPKDFPLGGGGGGGGGLGGGGSGSGSDDIPDANPGTLEGRVCLVTDLRDPVTGCADLDAGNFTVTLGGNETTTLADGTFTIERPSGTGLTWRVTGETIVTSLAPLGLDAIIPAVTVTRYDEMLISNGIIFTPGQGSLFVDLVGESALAEGALATSDPAAQFATRYDGTSALTWDQDAASTQGVAWLPGIESGTAQITVTPATVPAQTFAVSIEDGAITFATLELTDR